MEECLIQYELAICIKDVPGEQVVIGDTVEFISWNMLDKQVYFTIPNEPFHLMSWFSLPDDVWQNYLRPLTDDEKRIKDILE